MITFLIVFVPAAGLPLALIFPAFNYSRRKKEKESPLLPLVHVPALLVLFRLLSIGFGRPQSLGNLVEFFILGAAGVLVAYLKVFVVDRFHTRHTLSTYVSAALLVFVSVALRLFMPTMPE